MSAIKYKCVDDFNGHVHSNHKTLEAATQVLDKWRKAFYQRNPGAEFRGAIVPEESAGTSTI